MTSAYNPDVVWEPILILGGFLMLSAFSGLSIMSESLFFLSLSPSLPPPLSLPPSPCHKAPLHTTHTPTIGCTWLEDPNN